MSESTEAIQRLIYTYAERIDAADFEGLGRLFEHAVIKADGNQASVRGAKAVRKMYETANRVHADGTLRTKHLVSNVIVEVDEASDRASARSYYTVFQATPELPLQPIIAGRYRDRFERVDGAWRFAERYIQVDLVGDLSQHLTFELPPVRR